MSRSVWFESVHTGAGPAGGVWTVWGNGGV
jgi:hypothetical protein